MRLPINQHRDRVGVSRRSVLLAGSLAVPVALNRLYAADAQAVDAAAASGYQGGIATGNAAATRAGHAILREGGNAADAAAAGLLVLSVCDPAGRELHCFGGEVPILVFDPKKKAVEVLAGQGAAPRLATRKHFESIGGIPRRGSQAAAVPALLDACVTLLLRHGTMSFADCATATMEMLEAGSESWQQNLLTTFKTLCVAESSSRGSRNEQLAAVSDAFYRGSIARDLDDWARKHDALLRYEDLAAHRTRVEQPLTVSFSDHQVYKCGPWTQGPYLLQALQILSAIDGFAYLQQDPDAIHTVVETMKLALADRDAFYADPLFSKVLTNTLLSSEYARMRRPLVDAAKASLQLRPGNPAQMQPLLAGYHWDAGSQRPVMDTTNCVTADREGRMVVATPSGWAGALAGDTGIRLGSRLQSFNLWPDHPNCIMPGKRPRITLTPTLMVREGRPVAGISVAGGDWQDQVALQILLQYVADGASPQVATATPRFGTRHLIGSFGQPPPQLGNLTLDPRLAPDVADALRSRGHKIEVTSGPIGAPCMVSIDKESGRVDVAGDPATGRVALAH
ncbi:MAG: gamma-glutamyltransferase [Planctomycetota bacterium]|nr:gamma-glutamyltransferase [Planctomycetota bacterium]